MCARHCRSVADLENFRPFWDRLDVRCLSYSFLCCCCDTKASSPCVCRVNFKGNALIDKATFNSWTDHSAL